MQLRSLFSQALRLASDPKQNQWIFPLLLLADAALTTLIVWKIPCTLLFIVFAAIRVAYTCFADTEIDFATYMAQVRTYLKGTRDYTLIEGPTGPCVYPAGHVYAYSLLYKLSEDGTDIATSQVIFAGLYLLCLFFVGLVYTKCEVRKIDAADVEDGWGLSSEQVPDLHERDTYSFCVGSSVPIPSFGSFQTTAQYLRVAAVQRLHRGPAIVSFHPPISAPEVESRLPDILSRSRREDESLARTSRNNGCDWASHEYRGHAQPDWYHVRCSGTSPCAS